MAVYECVIKIDLDDPPAERAEQIARGISYACALLQDEYGKTTDEIRAVLEAAADNLRFVN